MLYLMLASDRLHQCETPEQAVRLIIDQRVLPTSMRIWKSDEPLQPIDFEKLQQMIGHDPLTRDDVEEQAKHLSIDIERSFRRRKLYPREIEHKVSTSGLPSGHPAVDRNFGNPAIQIEFEYRNTENSNEDPPAIGPTEMREMVESTRRDHGWKLIHSVCGPVTRLAERSRRITLFLSRPRGDFDEVKEEKA